MREVAVSVSDWFLWISLTVICLPVVTEIHIVSQYVIKK